MNDLQRDAAGEFLIIAFVNGAHAAAADGTVDADVTDSSADEIHALNGREAALWYSRMVSPHTYEYAPTKRAVRSAASISSRGTFFSGSAALKLASAFLMTTRLTSIASISADGFSPSTRSRGTSTFAT